MSLRSWAGVWMFRPNKMNPPGLMERKREAVAGSSSGPGTPTRRS